MQFNKHQLSAILVFGALFLILLFGFATKPKKLLKEELSRSLNRMITSAEILRQEAFAEFDETKRARFRSFETQEEIASDTMERIEFQKQLSGMWYREGRYGLAGHYAEQIAKLSSQAEAWGIAGTTFAFGINNSASEKEKEFCRQKSLEALENAISIDPQNIDYQINRSLILAEHPDPENPMRGIQLLLDLNKNYPENVTIMNNLAKFALQTKQYDRAEERLLTALSLEPDNKATICLLAELYESLGNQEKSSEFSLRCNNAN